MDMELVLVLLIATTFSGSFGAIALKKAMNVLPKLSLKKILLNKWVYLGCVLYFISAVTNIFLLKFLDYSIAFPMTSLSYVWTVIISYFIFNESLSFKKIIAVFLIVAGVFVIS